MAEPVRSIEMLRPLQAPDMSEGLSLAAIMLAGCILALALAAWLRPRWQRRHGVRRAALAALAASRALAPGERIAAQSMLLRRVLRTLGHGEAARGQGEAWLASLDAIFATPFFTQGAGQSLAGAQYRPARQAVAEALDEGLARVFAGLRR